MSVKVVDDSTEFGLVESTAFVKSTQQTSDSDARNPFTRLNHRSGREVFTRQDSAEVAGKDRARGLAGVLPSIGTADRNSKKFSTFTLIVGEVEWFTCEFQTACKCSSRKIRRDAIAGAAHAKGEFGMNRTWPPGTTTPPLLENRQEQLCCGNR